MNIGFLQPYSLLAIDVATLLKQFAKDGHKVVFITLSPKGHIHEILENEDIIFEFLDDGSSKKVRQMLPKAKDIIKLCKKYELDVLYNNFSTSQLIGLLASPFCKTKMVYLRHHSTDAAQEYGTKKGAIVDKLMNQFTSRMIVPSERVKSDVIKEGFMPENVVVIPYCYDFESYPEADERKVLEIKKRFDGKRILLMVSRYAPQKRYELAIEIAKKLKESGLTNFVFLTIGSGGLKENIKQMVIDNDLQEFFFVEGFKEDILTYIAACDLFVHTSASEASCHAVKEAGWLKKNVVCCENVGDFSDYLVNGVNAFVVDKDFPVEPMFEIIRRFLQDEIRDQDLIAEQLRKTILNRFTPEAAIVKHYELIDSILTD